MYHNNNQKRLQRWLQCLKKKEGANIPRTIRFTEELFEQYTNLSKETGVSFNELVLRAMRYSYKDLVIEDDKPKKEDK